MFENHRTGPGDFPCHCEALDQTQHHQHGRCPEADLAVGRQQAHGHGGETHEEHAQQQDVLAAACIAPVAQEERTDGAGNIAHAVGGQRGNDGDLGVGVGEKDLRENQRRGLGINEEVVVFQGGTDPSAGGGLLGLLRAVRF